MRITSSMLAFAAVTFALASGCATTTRIVSEPAGAVVIREKDNKELGAAPVDVQTSMWIWESEKYTVKKGDAKKTIELKRSEVDLLPMIGGVCLSLTGCGIVVGLPIILAGGMKLQAETKVSLDDAKPKSAALAPDDKRKLAKAVSY